MEHFLSQKGVQILTGIKETENMDWHIYTVDTMNKIDN